MLDDLFNQMSSLDKEKYHFDVGLFSKVYQLYNHMLLDFLDRKLHLFEKEQKLYQSIYQIKPVEKQKQEFFQSFSYLDFFFIRNPLQINELFSKEIGLFTNINNFNEIDWDKDSFIQETYLRVIINNQKKIDKINYGPFYSPKYYVSTNMIVLGIIIDPKYSDGNSNNPNWLKNYIQQELMVKDIIEELQKEIQSMKLNVKVIEYNETTLHTE